MIEIALVEDNPNDRDNLIKALDRFSKEENEPIHPKLFMIYTTI